MTPEQKFWQLLKPHIPGHVVRIENSLGSGIPDVNYCYEGMESWIELKAGSKLLTSQRVWMETRLKNGGDVLLVERIDNSIVISEYFYSMGLKTENKRTFPKPFDWPTIEKIFKGEV